MHFVWLDPLATFPKPQSLQSAFPGSSMYEPGEQGKQNVRPSIGCTLPAAQSSHTAIVFAPMDVENLPGGHALHALLAISPSISEYLPTSHARQRFSFIAPRTSLQNPLAHLMQSCDDFAPTVSRNLPLGHTWQPSSALFASASTLPNRPRGQLSQIFEVVFSAKKPRPHGVQAPWFRDAVKKPAGHSRQPVLSFT
jgi:hypothetical protein